MLRSQLSERRHPETATQTRPKNSRIAPLLTLTSDVVIAHPTPSMWCSSSPSSFLPGRVRFVILILCAAVALCARRRLLDHSCFQKEISQFSLACSLLPDFRSRTTRVQGQGDGPEYDTSDRPLPRVGRLPPSVIAAKTWKPSRAREPGKRSGITNQGAELLGR